MKGCAMSDLSHPHLNGVFCFRVLLLCLALFNVVFQHVTSFKYNWGCGRDLLFNIYIYIYILLLLLSQGLDSYGCAKASTPPNVLASTVACIAAPRTAMITLAAALLCRIIRFSFKVVRHQLPATTRLPGAREATVHALALLPAVPSRVRIQAWTQSVRSHRVLFSVRSAEGGESTLRLRPGSRGGRCRLTILNKIGRQCLTKWCLAETFTLQLQMTS